MSSCNVHAPASSCNNLLARFIACVLELPVPVLRSEFRLVQMLQEWAPGLVRPAGLPLSVLSVGGLPVLQGRCRHPMPVWVLVLPELLLEARRGPGLPQVCTSCGNTTFTLEAREKGKHPYPSPLRRVVTTDLGWDPGIFILNKNARRSWFRWWVYQQI